MCIITEKFERDYYVNLMKKNPMRHVMFYRVVVLRGLSSSLGFRGSWNFITHVIKCIGSPDESCGHVRYRTSVCAQRRISELVKNNVNGCTFNDSNELASQLIRLLSRKSGNDELKRYRKNLKPFREDGWASRWNRLVLPMFV